MPPLKKVLPFCFLVHQQTGLRSRGSHTSGSNPRSLTHTFFVGDCLVLLHRRSESDSKQHKATPVVYDVTPVFDISRLLDATWSTVCHSVTRFYQLVSRFSCIFRRPESHSLDACDALEGWSGRMGSSGASGFTVPAFRHCLHAFKIECPPGSLLEFRWRLAEGSNTITGKRR